MPETLMTRIETSCVHGYHQYAIQPISNLRENMTLRERVFLATATQSNIVW